MRQLIHNGILIPKYEWKALHIKIKSLYVELKPDQEEMAAAWVKKLGTPYVEDKVFIRNFFDDFCNALNMGEKLNPEDFDFTTIQEYIDKDKNFKLSLSKEEKKRLSEQRKALREVNKEKFGYAIIDGIKSEISNYMAEPSCIFMGRGRHPLRGRWKMGPREEDIELNLSPEAPRMLGNWKAILWQPDVMWIARWKDKLSSKIKYVWLSETSFLKQKKDIEKFDKAKDLRRNIARIQDHIWKNLDAEDQRRRKTATVCFLIDKLKIRVGDEKDPDEADTVGASTLRPEHLRFEEDGRVTINFLGKDSVPHIFVVDLPDRVVRNLKEFSGNIESNLFNGVDSQRVSEFLDEEVNGLSAKVFRTYYASEAVENKLNNTPVKFEAPDYVKKYTASIANLEAAKVCNHRRAIPKTWESSLQKQELVLGERIRRSKESQDRRQQRIKQKEEKETERLRLYEKRVDAMIYDINKLQQQLVDWMKNPRKPATSFTIFKNRINQKQEAVRRERQRIENLKRQWAEQRYKLLEIFEKQRQRDEDLIKKLRLQIKAKKETRDYNLVTSLKSYIDPRIYYQWGQRVDYGWKLYYPKTLQKKFSWVETVGNIKIDQDP